MSKRMGVEKRGDGEKKKVVKGFNNSLEGKNIVSKVVVKH
jgi:hypothetical protein